MPTYHVYSQTKADGADTSFIKPSDWNSVHIMPFSRFVNIGGAPLSTVNLTASTRSLFVFPLIPDVNVFPGDLTASTMRMLVSIANTTTATNVAAYTFSLVFGIYRVSASNSQSTLSLLNSCSWVFSGATTASTAFSNSLSCVGGRWITIHSSQWSSAPVFNDGSQYIGAMFFSTAGPAVQTWIFYGEMNLSTLNVQGAIGAASVTNTTVGVPYYGGVYSATTASLPATINFNQLNRQAANANFVPLIEFDMLNVSH